MLFTILYLFRVCLCISIIASVVLFAINIITIILSLSKEEKICNNYIIIFLVLCYSLYIIFDTFHKLFFAICIINLNYLYYYTFSINYKNDMIEITDKDKLEEYSRDASNFQGYVDNVFLPESITDLKKIVEKCYNSSTPVHISGSGTGLAGARVPFGGTLISLERLNKIISIDTETQTAILQPGVLQQDFQNTLNELGYFYPPNPTEILSSFGGNIANNSSGSRTFKYGATRNYVQRLKILLMNGDELILDRGHNYGATEYFEVNSTNGKRYKIPRPTYGMPDTKHSAGYFSKPGMNPIDLFIGSEGTLGVVTEVTLRFLKKPDNILGLIIFFDSMESTLDFVRTLQKKCDSHRTESQPIPDYTVISDTVPRLIEFFDDKSLDLLREEFTNIPHAASAIWIEQEYSKEFEDELLTKWFNLINQYTKFADETWTAMSDKEHEKFREFRHQLPLKIVEINRKNNQQKFGTDIAVPNIKLKEFYKFLLARIKQINVDYVIYGHIGNSHFHANIFYKNEKELELSNEFYDDSVDKVLELHGTVSAEHGIGKIKKKYLLRMYGEKNIQEMKQIKKSLDDKYILGLGTLFD